MKKQSVFYILVTIIIGLTSHTLIGAQTDKFPPIQSYFDKTVGQQCRGFYGLDKIISQQISNNTIIMIKEKSTGEQTKKIYSNLDFSKLSRVTTYEEDYGTKKIICLAFWFTYDITITTYENGKLLYDPVEEDRFHCYILAKDEKAVVKLFNDWIK